MKYWVQVSRSVVSDSLWPRGPQHARPPCAITNSWSLPKLTSMESVMPSHHLIFCNHLILSPTRDWPRLACECPGVSSGGVGWWWPAAGLGALSVAIHAWDLLKEVTIIFLTSTIVWPTIPSSKLSFLIGHPKLQVLKMFPMTVSFLSGSGCEDSTCNAGDLG